MKSATSEAEGAALRPESNEKAQPKRLIRYWWERFEGLVMIFRKLFKNGLVKGELDTSGTDAILRVEVDSVVLESEREEYEREVEKSEETNYEYADRSVKIEIDSGLKEAREWAREITKKRIKVVFTEE
jgi:hypothetical protein